MLPAANHQPSKMRSNFSRLAVAILVPLAFALCLLTGCAHQAPRAIALPTTAAVRAPIVAAAASNGRSLTLARRAQVAAARAVGKGMVAGSEEAKELASLTLQTTASVQTTQDQLTAALLQVGKLDADLAAAKVKVDAQTKAYAAERVARLRAETERAAAEHRKREWMLGSFALAATSVLLDLFCGAELQEIERAAASAALAAIIKGLTFLRLTLKAACPTFFFWL